MRLTACAFEERHDDFLSTNIAIATNLMVEALVGLFVHILFS